MMPNQGYCYRHVVRSLGVEHTLEFYLANAFPHSTEAEWRERIQAGEVLVDGRVIDGLVHLRPGSLLAWNRPGWIEEGTPTTLFCNGIRATHLP
jgi:23S rRNA pseudouridine1911/1915/1917 synthase